MKGEAMTYTVTYNANGAASGNVPVDPNSPYPPGVTVTVLGNSGKLAASSGYFVYWNTKADGSGTIYNPNNTFKINANTTLYAQLINNSGDSANNLSNGGVTANFAVTYPVYTGLPAAQLAPMQANLVANANYLVAGNKPLLETAFNTATGWFATPTGKFGTSHPQAVVLDLADNGGAYNNGYPSTIHTDGQYLNSDLAVAGPEVAMVFAAEFAEVLMAIAGNWNAGDSSGEGLSQYCAYNLFSTGYISYYGAAFIQAWLNGTGSSIVTNQGTVSPNPARSDFVSKTYTGSTVNGVSVHGDGDPVSFGCALGFIYYLTVQLGFSIKDVISNYTGTMASCYNTLTGDPSQPWPIYSGLIASAYPPGTPVTSLPGTNPQNLFPCAEVQFYVQKNTYGKDETQDYIDTLGGLVSEAFWVVITGFSKNSFESLGITVTPFTGSFAALQSNNLGLKITPNAVGPQFENGVNATTPQTIRIPYDITFSSPILDQFPASGVSSPYVLSVALTANGTAVTGSQASIEFEFIAGADPYFANVDATNNQPYLSQDLRVFQVAPALPGQQVPFPNGPAFGTDSIAGAYSYIQALLGYLNGSSDFTNPGSGIDAFSLLPGQSGEGQTDSSVAPIALNPDLFQSPLFANNYNFAIARVRLRGEGTATSPATAEQVRVFFRVFGTSTNDTDYDPSTNGTYAFEPDAKGEPGTPVFGGTAPNNVTTIPFFATDNAGAETDYQSGGVNNQTLVIPFGQNQLYAYYGAFLNFYDPNYMIDNQAVQSYLPGTHHCLVAEIAYDDAPIPVGVPATSWDQLAQRNLQFTTVDNPGPVAAHRAPQTFDTRPSATIGEPGTGTPPDELMIEWGNVPVGSVASLYWPGVAAADVITLLREWGGTAPITASDANTLAIPVEGGITYIPIPTGSGQNFAGLFTLELPLGITTGQEFEVLVRRLATRSFNPPVPPPPAPILQTGRSIRSEAIASPPGDDEDDAPPIETATYRYVVGTFVVRIPVSTSAAMLFPEASTLAIMKWRLANMSPANRWYPVIERYIAYSSARFNAVGGDASSIPPSLVYVPPGLIGAGGGEQGETTICGKVVEVRFDCHGDFIGFVLDGCCCKERLFETRERAIGDLALRAAQLNLRLCVTVNEKCGRIASLVIAP
jgi:hypothetical protein